MKTIIFKIALTFLILNFSHQANASALIFPGLSENESSGYSVSKLGDINGDGFDDIVSGAFGYNGNQGRVYIYLGGDFINTAPDIILTGENPDDKFGWSVTGAGDFNNDGKTDVLIGAPGYNNNTGRVYLFLGNGSGINTTPAVIMNGEAANQYFGYAVSGAGLRSAFPYPLNDTYEDIMIGAYGWDGDLHTEPYRGKVYLVLGRAIPLPVVTLFISPTDPENYVFQGEAAGWYFGNSLSFGEFDGNLAHSDLLVGAPGYNTNTGRVYLYLGTGIVSFYEGTQQSSYFGASISNAGDIDLNGYDDIIIGAGGIQVGPDYVGRAYIYDPLSTNAVTITGQTDPLGSFGSVSNLGDVNGDTYSDIGIGAYSIDNFSGRAYIFKGRPDFYTFFDNYTALSSDIFASGATGDGFGSAISGAGDFNGDGLSDCLIGSPYRENGTITNSGACYLYFDSPLPVELTYFSSSVIDNNVTLIWTTSGEINNSGFEIERLNANGQTSDVWSKISFVSGHGTSSTTNSYEYTDRNLASGKYNYRLKQIDYNGNYEYFYLTEEVVIGVPEKFELSQNYPNPFNPVTNLEFGISNLEFVSLKVYDAMGKEVATLVNEIKPAGRYQVTFNGSNFASGVYFYKITAGNFSLMKKMLLIK